MRKTTAIRFTLLATLTAGCHKPAPLPAASHASMPTLAEVPVVIDSADAPVKENAQMSLTADGHVTYMIDDQSPHKFVTLDSTGHVQSRWGRAGEGPGESEGGTLLSADSAVVLDVPSIGAIQRFDNAGRLLSEVRNQFQMALPLAVVGDSIDRTYSQRLVGTTHILDDVHGPLARVCIGAPCKRILLAAEDTIWRTVQLATPRHEGTQWPPYAADRSRFVIGDGVGYRLWMFDANGVFQYRFGRTVPPRRLTPREIVDDESAWAKQKASDPHTDVDRLRAFALAEPLPHFTYGGLGFDEHRRLFVVGKRNDSTFVDVFADSVFLGRRMIDCQRDRGKVAVRGHWLALVCPASVVTDAVPITIRLFRIVG